MAVETRSMKKRQQENNESVVPKYFVLFISLCYISLGVVYSVQLALDHSNQMCLYDDIDNSTSFEKLFLENPNKNYEYDNELLVMFQPNVSIENATKFANWIECDEMVMNVMKLVNPHPNLINYLQHRQDIIYAMEWNKMVPFAWNHHQQYDPPWGLDRIDQQFLPLDGVFHSQFIAGDSSIKVYLLDTGIGNEDKHGHGTSVASVIAGMKTGVCRHNCELVSINVANGKNNHSTLYNVLSGIENVIQLHNNSNDKAIVVLPVDLSYCNTSSILDYVLNTFCSSNKFIIVNSQGNGYFKHQNVLSVGSIDRYDEPDYNNQRADFYAPGKMIQTYGPSNNRIYRSGTSLSAGFTAGVLALFIQSFNYTHTNHTVNNIRDHFIENNCNLKFHYSSFSFLCYLGM